MEGVVQLLKKGDYKTMRWKNGHGITREIDIYPKASVFPEDSFQWRLSSATVPGPNDFSQFPGYDRILAVWKGSGLKLNSILTMEPLIPYHFAGEETVHCELLDEDALNVVDFGVIYRRDSVIVSLDISSAHELQLSAGTHYVTVIEGPCICNRLESNVDEGDTLRLFVPPRDDLNIALTPTGVATLKYFHARVYDKVT